VYDIDIWAMGKLMMHMAIGSIGMDLFGYPIFYLTAKLLVGKRYIFLVLKNMNLFHSLSTHMSSENQQDMKPIS